MSRTTRRKHVLKEMMEDDFELPKENQQIVRVVSSRGNNLLEVETAITEADNFLVSLPCKFRKNVWIKRGDFVLVEPIEEGDKVKAEVCKTLTPDHVKEYTKAGIWPKKFTKKREHDQIEDNSDDSMDEAFTVRNMNRPAVVQANDDDDDDDDSDDSDNDEDSDDVTQ